MDSRRYFPTLNIASSTQQQSWEREWTKNLCIERATVLLNKCLANTSHSGSSSSLKKDDGGSLYCGSLGPRVYLRMRLGLLDAAEADCKTLNHRKQRKTKQRVTLLESPIIGSKTLLCAIHKRQGKQVDVLANEILEILDEWTLQLDPDKCEVLYGRAGAMHVILFLRRELGLLDFGTALLGRLAKEVLEEGKRTATENPRFGLPLLWVWHDKAYLGAAHGLVGNLQTLLSLSRLEWSRLQTHFRWNILDTIQQTIEALDNYCFPSGNLASSVGSTRQGLVHWCHGAPGHVLLLVKAHEVFELGQQRRMYLDKAIKLTQTVVWPYGLLKKGVGLCHGISGNAYVFLALARYDPTWLQHARAFCNFAWDNLEELEHAPDRPYSLYGGIGGLACLLLDLCDPEHARFPLYEF